MKSALSYSRISWKRSVSGMPRLVTKAACTASAIARLTSGARPFRRLIETSGIAISQPWHEPVSFVSRVSRPGDELRTASESQLERFQRTLNRLGDSQFRIGFPDDGRSGAARII